MRMMNTVSVSPEMLALQRLYHWERTAPSRITLTQPLGGGVTQNFTWSQVTFRCAAWRRT